MIHLHITLRRRRRQAESGTRQVTYWIALVRGEGLRFRGRTRAEAFGRAALYMARRHQQQPSAGGAS